jgi:hypothetical protein
VKTPALRALSGDEQFDVEGGRVVAEGLMTDELWRDLQEMAEIDPEDLARMRYCDVARVIVKKDGTRWVHLGVRGQCETIQ